MTVPPAPVAAHHQKLKANANATLRDQANFVIGNVFVNWRVDVFTTIRAAGYWVEVYVPHAKRCGYIEAYDLT